MLQLYSKDIKRISVLQWSIRRHFKYLFRHWTIRKVWNALRCVLQMEANRSFLRSFPFYLRVNASSLCNLSCAGCCLGHAEKKSLPPAISLMNFDLFKKSLRDFLPYLLKVNMYDEGEPLLNRDIGRMAAWLSKNNVGSCISSNFSLMLSDERIIELVTCGLEHLIVALDGGTQENYGRYRIGGDLELVLSNLQRLMEIRRRTPSSRLDVELQFIEFEHNCHEKDQVFQWARELGIPRFTVIQGSSVHGWDGLDFQGSEQERRRLGCYHLWVSSHINTDGSLYACDYGEDHGFSPLGFAWEFLSLNLRNHSQLVSLRNSFKHADQRLDKVCSRCSLYRKALPKKG